MIGLSVAADAEAANSDQPCDNADAPTQGFEARPLLDMGFEVTENSLRIAANERALVAQDSQGFGERHTVFGFRRSDLRVSDVLAERTAAQAGQERALLVLERDDVDADPRSAARLDRGASDLKAVDDTQRTVEPAALRDRVSMRTDEDRAIGVGIATVYVPDRIHLRRKAGLANPVHQPAPRFDIRGGQRYAVHPRAEFTDGGKLAQVGDEAVGVDQRHGYIFHKLMNYLALLNVLI